MGTQLFLFSKRASSQRSKKQNLMISKNALEEYKEIHRQETGEVFSDDVLLDEAINLLTLFDRVYRPIKKEWLKEYGRQYKTNRGMANNLQPERKISQESSTVRELQEESSRPSQK
jgi:hypothetical protein